MSKIERELRFKFLIVSIKSILIGTETATKTHTVPSNMK